MKELLRKKSVRISILLIILLVVMGIVGINVRSAQRSKEYDDHITAAEKYLSDLDYEQAIAEYTMAFEIDPKEEVVDALEQAYFAYAQTCIDAGNYEKAISILEEGYEKIGRESLQNKTEEFRVIQEKIRAKEAEIQEQKRLEEEQRRLEEERRASGMVEFPFRAADITIRGYDLFGNYYTQLKELYLAEAEKVEWYENDVADRVAVFRTPDGIEGQIDEYEVTSNYIVGVIGVWGWNGRANYGVGYMGDSLEAALTLEAHTTMYSYEEINAPVKPGETYEDWCRVMQIDQIKEYDLQPEERDGVMGIWNEDVCILRALDYGGGAEHWIFSTEWYQGIYNEYEIENGWRFCSFQFTKPSGYVAREDWPIQSIRADINEGGVIVEVYYFGWPITE